MRNRMIEAHCICLQHTEQNNTIPRIFLHILVITILMYSHANSALYWENRPIYRIFWKELWWGWYWWKISIWENMEKVIVILVFHLTHLSNYQEKCDSENMNHNTVNSTFKIFLFWFLFHQKYTFKKRCVILLHILIFV